MNSKERKILVTGATGLVGSYLIRYLLQAGYTNIIALKRATSNTELLGASVDKIEFREGDLNDYDSLKEALVGVEKVYHCAALVSFDDRDKKNLINVNVNGTANLVDLSIDAGVRKLVHVSSIAAVGKKPGKVVSESDFWQKNDDMNYYSLTKFLGEQEVWRGYAEGLSVAIVNPTIIIGSGFWEVGSNKFFKQADNGFRFFTQGNTGFVDVRDVVKFMHLIMESDVEGERYILNAVSWPYKQLMDECAKAVGKKGPDIGVGKVISSVIWRLEWLRGRLTGKRPMITKSTAKNAQTKLNIDNSKSLQVNDFKYRPLETSVQETGKQFMEAKANNWKASVLEFNSNDFEL